MRAKYILWIAAVLLAIAGTVPRLLITPSATAGSSEKAATEKQATAAEIARGQKTYDARCEICHFSTSANKKIGPGLKGLAVRGKYSDGKKVDDENLRGWIEKGGKNMPGYKGALKEDEIRNLIAYLKTL
jgi:cytochrome c